MKFDYTDKSDSRLVMASPFALDYPDDVEWAPLRAGVYMFIDADVEVVYIGKASGGRLKDAIITRRGTNAERDAVRYRWFQTDGNQTASELASDWIKKYEPRNNILGV
jgi:excinuclease UvrABC nuclease subunit